MKKQATMVTLDDSIRISGERQYGSPSKRCRYQKPHGIIRGGLTVTFIFNPSETGHPERVVVPITAAVYCHRASNRSFKGFHNAKE